MYETLSPYVLGVAMAVVTCYPARALDSRREQWFFSAIMTFVAVSFFAFPLEQGDSRGTMHELGAMVVFLTGVGIGLKWKPALGLTFFAHGSWDLMYLFGVVQSSKPDWLVELCVPYDWLLAAYLFARVRTWRS